MLNDDHKLRYVYRNKYNGTIKLEILTIRQIEAGRATPIDAWENIESEKWQLIARDRWTGLKDKNGVDVFEHDKVGIGNGSSVTIIYYNFGFKGIQDMDKKVKCNHGCEKLLVRGNFVGIGYIKSGEVIGNVHEG